MEGNTETVRVEAGPDWVEMRGISTLSWGDQEAWDSALDAAWDNARATALDPDTGERRMIPSPDGTTMVPVPYRAIVTPEMIRKRRDDMLGRLITAWSYETPLPYTADAKPLISREMGAALMTAFEPYAAAFQDEGPKEKTEPTTGSASTSKARRTNSRPA